MPDVINFPPQGQVAPVNQVVTPPVTPPVVEPVVTPPVDPNKERFDQLQQLIVQQNQEIAALNQRIQSAPAPVQPIVQTPAEKIDFFTEPQRAIKQQVDESIAPINAFIQTFNRGQVYLSNKVNIKNAYPALTQYWNIIEPQLDAVFSGGAVEPSVQNVHVAISNIVGSLALRNPQVFNQQVNPQTPVNQQIIPPSVPSAAPVNPVVTPQVQVKLTEQQKTVARASGLTDEDFYARLNKPTIIEGT